MRPYLRIEKPCEEPLNNMHDVPGGKHCDLCSKKVLDLSNLKDAEILKIIQENKGEKFCGIFFKNQLNRPLQEKRIIANSSPRKITFSKAAAGLALTASMISSYPAQTTAIHSEEITLSADSKRKTNDEEPQKDDTNFVISGRIIASDKGIPIPAEVSFITVLKVYTTTTDKDGYYHLEVPKDILKYESLLEFSPDIHSYDKKLAIYTIENLGKKQLIKLDYNGSDKMYGEITYGPPLATEKSLVIAEGKKLDYKLFNKSYSLFPNKYEVHYIPKEFVKFFTQKETINNIYIVFIK
ncbi:carboxypeptidase-like regulatory domain-containing protein [Chryseobacterium taiwanense]|uniref:Uncharacterized protein n=1 Tax=Chryseobacterium taiwanense TaxID=363331 RepID=A0A0B4ECZ9_9FLAO|nr:carboxypeptidase-like regulatory domain-containing protein [Chryseobacterium taiwanense]KIC64513.1 hypothetical protein RM51_02940 [Chryseobacterium taiwanense]